MSFRIAVTIAIVSLSAWHAASAQAGTGANTLVPCEDISCGQSIDRRAQMKDPESIHTGGQSQMQTRTRARAQAKITVHSSEAKPYDQIDQQCLAKNPDGYCGIGGCGGRPRCTG